MLMRKIPTSSREVRRGKARKGVKQMDAERGKRDYAGVLIPLRGWSLIDEARSNQPTAPPSNAQNKKRQRNESRQLTFRGLKGGTAEEFASRASTRGPASGSRRSEGKALLCTR